MRSRAAASFKKINLCQSGVVPFVLIFLYISVSILVGIPASDFYYDEGHYAAVAKLYNQDWKLYEDIQLNYTPNAIMLYASVFRLFGDDLVFVRYLSVLIFSLSALLLYTIAKNFTDSTKIATISLIFFLITIATYDGARLTASSASILFSLCAFYCHIKLMSENSSRWAFFLGCNLALIFFTKHNIGVYETIAHLSVFVYGSKNKSYCSAPMKLFFTSLLGAVCISVPYVISLVKQPHLIAFLWEDLIVSTRHYATAGAIPFPMPGDFLRVDDFGYVVRNVSLYSVFFLAIGALFGLRALSGLDDRLRTAVCLLFILALVNYAQVFPRVGLSHYVRASTYIVLASLVQLFFVWRSNISRRLVAMSLLVSALIVHSVSATLVTGVKFYSSMSKDFSALPFSANFKSFIHEGDLLSVISKVNNMSPLNQSQVVFLRYPQLYYLTTFVPINRYLEIQPFKLTRDQEQEFLRDLEVYQVKVVVVGPEVQSTDFEVIDEKITADFSLVYRIGEFDVYCRRNYFC